MRWQLPRRFSMAFVAWLLLLLTGLGVTASPRGGGRGRSSSSSSSSRGSGGGWLSSSSSGSGSSSSSSLSSPKTSWSTRWNRMSGSGGTGGTSNSDRRRSNNGVSSQSFGSNQYRGSSSSNTDNFINGLMNKHMPQWKLNPSSTRGSGTRTYGSSSGSRLKKYAVLGAGVYGGYKLGKLRSKFGRRRHHYGSSGHYGGGGGGGYDFNSWNELREAEGQLCRNDEDCTWVDPRMFCQNYRLEFEPNNLWFGGDVASIRGACACPQGWGWDNAGRSVDCQRGFFGKR